jgi:protein TonB
LLAPPASTDEREEIEGWLRATYEGKQVRLRNASTRGDIRLDMPKELAQAIDPQAPLHLLIGNLRMKKKDLELRVQRIYFYQTTQGEIQGIKGEPNRLRFRWPGTQPDKKQLQEALEETLFVLTGNLTDWPEYWPPLKPPNPAGQIVREQPSREIAPGVFTIGSDVVPPNCDFCPDPGYPPQMRAQRVEGVGELATTIGKTGRVGGVRITKSAGHPLLDQSTVVAVSKWRFRPATRDGSPIRVYMLVESSFRLY